MTIIHSGVAFESSDNSFRSSLAFPGICVLPSGRWLASCRAAPQKSSCRGQYVLLSHSDDEGASWSTPRAPFTPPHVDIRLGLFRVAYLTALGEDDVLATLAWVDHSDPDAEFFNEETQGLLDTRIFFARSRDGGETWDFPQLMDTTPFNVPTPLTGPVLLLPNGEWACQFELNKPYHDLSEWRHSSVFMFSSDAGKAWPEYSITSNDPDNRVFYWDQRPSVLHDGRVLDLFWTYNNATASYLNIHARESKDNGRNWSPLRDTKVPGQPAEPVMLSDGRLVMIYVDREAVPMIKLRVSDDGGHSWPQASEEVLYESQLDIQTERKDSMQDAWSEMAKFALGLPATTVLPDDDVVVVFYAGPQTDKTDIRWLRLRI